MSQTIQCGKCGAKLIAPASGSFKCPKCGVSLSAGQPVELGDPGGFPAGGGELDFGSLDLPAFQEPQLPPSPAGDPLAGDPLAADPLAQGLPPSQPVPKPAAAAPGGQPPKKDEDKKGAASGDDASPVPMPVIIGCVVALVVLLIGGGGLLYWMSGGRDENVIVAKDSDGSGGSDAFAPRGATSSSSAGASSGSSGEMPWDVVERNRERRVSADRDKEQRDRATPAVAGGSSSSSQPPASQTKPGEKLTPDKVIQNVKTATVFVWVGTSAGNQTGSGFLVRKENVNGYDRGYIVTNAHVVEAEEGSRRESIYCVFYSGSKGERSVEARIVALDHGNDLAVLSVTESRNNRFLPDVLVAKSGAMPTETETVFAAGFPFGEAFKTGKRNPAITITKGSVSSIRRDDQNGVTLFQIDGGINPGNSGGPVVTEDGRLVGVAVAKVAGTSIGFVIPRNFMEETLGGRVAEARITQSSSSAKGGSYNFEIKCMDPLRKIQFMNLVAFRAIDQDRESPEPSGQWKIASDTLLAEERFSYSTGGPFGTGRATVKLIGDRDEVVFQIRCVRKDGSELITAPTQMPFGFIGNTDTSTVSMRTFGSSMLPQAISELNGLEIATLPTPMLDFLLNPKTGDLVSISPGNDSVYLFAGNDIDARADLKPNATQKVGKLPCSIVFKEFRDKSYYFVSCLEDPNVYVIPAQDFGSPMKVRTDGSGVLSLTCSEDPSDPFLYYNMVFSEKGQLGYIDLRALSDGGTLFENSGPAMISSDGRSLFRREHYSTSRVRVHRLTSGFGGNKPGFVQLPPYNEARKIVPGPFGEYVSLDQVVVDAETSTTQGTMSFPVQCFLKSKPVLIGASYSRSTSSNPKLLLRGFSYNDFGAVGKQVEIPSRLFGGNPGESRSRNSYRSFSTAGHRVLADEQHDRIIYAARDKLVSIPMDALKLPDEAFMRVGKLSHQLRVGRESRISVAPTDDRVSVELGELPEGAKKEGGELIWTPTDENVGLVRVPVTLRSPRQTLNKELLLDVSHPFMSIPIKADGFRVNPAASFCVCWTGPVRDEYGRVRAAAGVKSTVAVIPFRSGVQPIVNELPVLVSQLEIAGNRLAILASGDNQQVQVYDIKTLKRVKSLLSSSDVTRLQADGDQIVLHGRRTTDVYNLKTLKRVRSVDSVSNSSHNSSAGFVDGLLDNGVLRDLKTNKPKLVVSPGRVTMLHGTTMSTGGGFLRRISSSNTNQSSRSDSIRRYPPVTIGKSATQVTLENRLQTVTSRSNERRRLQQVSLTVSTDNGQTGYRVPIVERNALYNTAMRSPLIQPAGNAVMIALEDRIYRWAPSGNNRNPESVGDESSGELHFVPEQSLFVLSGRSNKLSHQLAGGEAPFDYLLMSRYPGIELNDETGEVSLDLSQLMNDAYGKLRGLSRAKDLPTILQDLQKRMTDAAENYTRITGRRPKGYPVCVPVHLRANDQNGSRAEIQYFVFLEIPLRELANRIGGNQ